MTRQPAGWIAGALFVLVSLPGLAGATSFGAVGDSLTDEYQGSAGGLPFLPKDLPGLNWVEQLVKSRSLVFGSYESDPSVRGEPRLDGFANNWARFGATALDTPTLGAPPFSTQVTGLAGEVSSGAVQVAYVGIGSNDVALRIESGARSLPAIRASTVSARRS